jgi:hypothetical protein
LEPFRGHGRRIAKAAPGCAAAMFTTGCSRAPTFNILGSYFPAWILCGVLGILMAVVVRVIFVRTNLEAELSPLIVIYPCLALLFTFTIWLLFFS